MIQSIAPTGSPNRLYEFDQEGNQVFRCLRGHAHSGEYAEEDCLRCDCPHPAILFIEGEDSGSCVHCGQEIEVIKVNLEDRMDWQKIITVLEEGTALIGAVVPGVAPTINEIGALEAIAAKLVSTLATQKGVPVEEVIAGLTWEDPNPDAAA